MVLEFIKSLFDDIDTAIEKRFAKLESYDVNSDELIDLIIYAADNGFLKKYNDLASELENILENNNIFDDFTDVKLLRNAGDILGGDLVPIYVNRISFVDYLCLTAVLFLTVLNFNSFNEYSIYESTEICTCSDFF